MELESADAELRRLYTFINWPSDAPVNALSLARHGFVYVGPPGARTQCTLCHLFIDSWRRGDNPAEIHRERSPLCPFVKSTNTVKSTNPIRAASPKSCGQHALQQGAGNDRSHDASSQRATNREYHVSARWHPCASQSQTAALQQSMQTTSSGSAVSSTASVCLVADSYGNTGRQQTATSQLYVDSTIRTNISRDINRQTSSVIIGLQPTTTENSTVSTRSSERPKRPEFSTLSARIRSFSSAKVSPGQTANGLAAAGFYYVGPADNVRCFWCNGGLKNFLPTDNPQTEHARWFPQCSFIQNITAQLLGEDFTGSPSNIASTIAATSQISFAAVAAATNNATTTTDHLLSTEESESTLLEENKQLKDARICKVCMDADADTVFLPCGHLVCCSNCSPSLRNCAICRALIRGTVKIFLSD